MNTSMMAGIGIGLASALALSATASGSRFTPTPTFAEVIASKPITETIKTPRQECRNVTVTHRKPVQDEHKILGTVVGAALGGMLGNQFGGGSGKKVATAAGAVAGGGMQAIRCRAICRPVTPIPTQSCAAKPCRIAASTPSVMM